MHTEACKSLDAEIMANIRASEQNRVIECAIKLVGTFRDANDIGEAMHQLSDAVDALKYDGDYKAID